jgi:hypothetical protein
MKPSIDLDVSVPEKKWRDALAAKQVELEREQQEFWDYMAASRGISEGTKMSIDWKSLRITITLPNPATET